MNHTLLQPRRREISGHPTMGCLRQCCQMWFQWVSAVRFGSVCILIIRTVRKKSGLCGLRLAQFARQDYTHNSQVRAVRAARGWQEIAVCKKMSCLPPCFPPCLSLSLSVSLRCLSCLPPCLLLSPLLGSLPCCRSSNSRAKFKVSLLFSRKVLRSVRGLRISNRKNVNS